LTDKTSIQRRNTFEVPDFFTVGDKEFTAEWSDADKPLFISEFPFEQGYTVYDCYFNMENSAWFKFDMGKITSRMLLAY